MQAATAPGVIAQDRSPFDFVRETTWAVILFVCFIQVCSAGIFLWTATVLSIAVSWTLAIGVGMFAWAKLRAQDLGLRIDSILPGIGYAVFWWGTVQVVLLSATAAVGQPLAVPGAKRDVGSLVDQLLIFASAEEIVYRGFLLPQLYLKFRRRFRGGVLPMVVAILVSEVFFGLLHIPVRVQNGLAWSDMPLNLVMTALAGVFFCLLYLQTANLLVPWAVHATTNVISLFAGPFAWQWKYAVIVVVALSYGQVYWARRRRRRRAT